jgi:outer membrane protein OmpA-like peptidoglycan-associated protein
VADQGSEAPLYTVTLVARTTQAVNYSGLRGATHIDFRGTPLQGRAEGHAEVVNRRGAIEIRSRFDGLEPASQFGPAFLTYVLWAITPEGRATNLGELMLRGDRSALQATTELKVFALIVTAEPHFAVTQPSDVVVLENVARADTSGRIQLVDAKYELLERGHYTLQVEPPGAGSPDPSKVSLELRQARRAVTLARNAGADRHARDTFDRATQLLADAEKLRSKNRAARLAREAVQTAEDARLIAMKRSEEESLAEERRNAQDREARARAETAEETRLRAAAEAARAAEAERRRAAELDRDMSEQARARAEQERLEAERTRAQAQHAAEMADAARRAAEDQQQAAEIEAERARMLAEQAERERLELRARLQEQLNRILETRDTARGLVVNMSDVLFATGKYDLQPGAREKLAKIAGIVLAHPGLELEIEGHTDSVGSEEYNQRLSEQRAGAVRDYLVQQSIPAPTVAARGFGESRPVASNDTAAERQQNRRVEIVVSGELIDLAARAGG